MDDIRFDALTRGLTNGTTRRKVAGGLLGGALAVLGGAAALEAKRGGKGKSKGKGGGNGGGNGRGKGNTKVSICHFSDDTGEYQVLTLGAPGADNHLKHHEDDTPFVDCCPGDACEAAECCTTAECVEGTCACTVVAAVDTPCTGGTCDGAGVCVPTPTP